MLFAEMALSPEILRAVEESGYTQPTPIQQEAIPLVLAGRDVQAAAQTGTGKTAAFVLPMLARIQPSASTSSSPAMHPVRLLILAPTRELADQVYQNAKNYAKYLPLRVACVYGGIAMKPQVAELQAGVDVLIATPGRLLDHVEQKTVNLSRVQCLVLDEADRMLDMGFIADIRRILSMMPPQRQTLLFSATFPPEIKRLVAEFMREPAKVEVARQNATNANIQQIAFLVESPKKRQVLQRLIRERAMTQVLVFTKTRHAADRLYRELKREGLECEAIHGDKAQNSRLAALAAFKEGKVQVLVATDVAARGLDIDSLPFVVNFELPGNPEDYVHRIGRTGRAGASGVAISLVAPEEQRLLEAIEKFIHTPIPVENLTPTTIPRMTEARGAGQSQARARRPQAPAEADFVVPTIPRFRDGESAPAVFGASGDRRGSQIPALFLPPPPRA